MDNKKRRPGRRGLGKPEPLAQDSGVEQSENENFEDSLEAMQYRETIDRGTSYEQFIDDALGGMSPRLVEHVEAVFQKIPKRDIRSLIRQQILIFAPPKPFYGRCIDLPGNDEDRILIYLSPNLLDYPEDQVRNTIAHELAHVVLGHSEEPCPDAPMIGENQERQADELAAQWGFPRPGA